MGTNVDCYQRAEGRYRLMPGILAALRDTANPFSILTKGTLILRDLDLIGAAAEVTDVGLAVSVGCTDRALWRELEPGTPSPQRRLEVCAAFSAAGLPCAVLMGPVVPFLSDSPARLEATVRQVAQAGATSVTPIVLHLRSGAREWFFRWLGEAHPELVPRYRALYGRGAYAPAAYQKQVTEQVRALARRYGVGRGAPSGAGGGGGPGVGPRRRGGGPRRFAPPAQRRAAPQTAAPQQLTLL
jgi:DNA repair photolyase